MSDTDLFTTMGISGFGKSAPKRQLDPTRFDKNKREVSRQCMSAYSQL